MFLWKNVITILSHDPVWLDKNIPCESDRATQGKTFKDFPRDSSFGCKQWQESIILSKRKGKAV